MELENCLTQIDYIRIPLNETVVYVHPDAPDWFLPTSRLDSILQSLQTGKNLLQAAEKDSVRYHSSIEYSLYRIKNILQRLDSFLKRDYRGRASHFKCDCLKECWFHVTNRCNLNCAHCMFCSGPQSKTELSQTLLLSSIRQAKELGCRIFYFTGGEPFVYEPLPGACEAILTDPESHIVILTNALVLEKHLCWLDQLDKQRIHFQISLDGTEQSHEALRGKNTYQKTIEMISRLTDQDFHVSLAMAVTDTNYSQMMDLIDIAGSVNVCNVHYMWFFQKGNAQQQTLPDCNHIADHLLKASDCADACNIKIDNIEILKTQLFSLPGTRFDLSNAGWQSLAIGPDGFIYPTPAMVGENQMQAGSVSEGLNKSWKQSPVLQKIRNATLKKDPLYNQNPFRYIIGGGDIDHSFIHSGEMTGGDVYLDLYSRILLHLLNKESQLYHINPDKIGLITRMGHKIYQCDGDMGEVNFTHSNCVLSLPGKDGHTLVRAFYSNAAEKPNEEILNPVHFAEEKISHVPSESRVRSYGCGSPVMDCGLLEGQTLVDLGSGTGVECFVAARIVGKHGRVIGIDMSDKMLELANTSKEKVAQNLGYDNIQFRKGFLELLPVETNSVDVVISNCVLNLSPDKRKVFDEIFRILKPAGRLVISDITYTQKVPLEVKYNEKLRGECIGGAFHESELFGLLDDCDFESAEISKRFLYRQVAGYNFYSITYSALKPDTRISKKVLYRGPFAGVLTEDGTFLKRGQETVIDLPKNTQIDESLFDLDEDGNVTNVKQEVSCCAFNSQSVKEDGADVDEKHISGCMVCGSEVNYLEHARSAKCYYCHEEKKTNTLCVHEHFVCDICHSKDAISIIQTVCLSSHERDMLVLMDLIRSHPVFPMNGPEHHSMIPAIVLTAYRNTNGTISDDDIMDGIDRGKTIAGGSCAFLGFCGAAAGVSIAFSIILKADPYKAKDRQTLQRITRDILEQISHYEAPRCCQRDGRIALQMAAKLSVRYLGVQLTADHISFCQQASKNDGCMGKSCPFININTKAEGQS